MADLLVTIQESITLPNRNKEVLSNTKTITDVNQTLRRIDTIPTAFSGAGVEILRFVDTEQEQTGGAFVKSSVKYVRITKENIKSSNIRHKNLHINSFVSDASKIILNKNKKFFIFMFNPFNRVIMKKFLKNNYINLKKINQ